MTKTLASLAPAPSFKLRVDVPLPGGDTAELTLTVKTRNRPQLQAFLEGNTQAEGQDAIEYERELILKIAEGWEVGDSEPFTPENVTTLVENYPLAAAAILEAYVNAHTNSRRRLNADV